MGISPERSVRVSQKSRTTQCYRLSVSTLGVNWSDGKGRHFRIPEGAVLSQLRTLEQGSPFVEILWNSQSLKIFAVDFKKRAIPISS